MPVFESQNIVLSVDNLWLAATAQFKDFSNSKALIAELMELLKKNGITTINKYNVKKALLEKDKKKKYVVTKGIPATDGKQEHYKLLVDIEKKPKPSVKDDGSVDYKELIIPNLVYKGDKILQKIPEDAGIAGKNIKGEPIAPKIIAVNSVLPSDDLVPDSDDENIFIAAKSGLVVQEGKKIRITTNLLINGDVNFSTGNIRFPGNVRVSGDVKSGFKINCDGNVEINGVVEDAYLEVGGDLKIKGGYTGTGAGKIVCKGTVNLTYAVNQTIECHTLKFQKEIVNCTVKAREAIHSDFGKIIGGNITAGFSIVVNQIGHEESAGAQITVGSAKELVEKKKELEMLIKKHNEKMIEVKDQLYNLFKKQIKKLLTEDEAEKLKNLQEFKNEAPAKIKELEEELTKINEEYEKIRQANITVKGPLYPGNKIEILGETMRIPNLRRKVKFIIHEGEVKVVVA